MARWGRATDIEYIYRVDLDPSGKVRSEVFQGFSHQTLPFQGCKEGLHPFILDATPNNVFADTGDSELQYRLLPVKADLSQHSREELMDRFPWTYRIMVEEMEHEGKIRPWGGRRKNAIGDPRDYLYLEMKAENRQTALVVWAKLKNQPRSYSSDRGCPDWAISRGGWFRTIVELSPGTRADAIEYDAVQCIGLKADCNAELEVAESKLEAFTKAFLLDSKDRPGPNLIESRQMIILHPGEMYAFSLSKP